jgi:hypothetical protein
LKLPGENAIFPLLGTGRGMFFQKGFQAMKKLCFLLFLFIFLLPCIVLSENSTLPAPKFKEVSVHDPSVIRDSDGTFYIYGSHMTRRKEH